MRLSTLIGAFGPYIRRLKMMGNPFYIVEKNSQTLRPDEMKYFKPESEMASALKEIRCHYYYWNRHCQSHH